MKLLESYFFPSCKLFLKELLPPILTEHVPIAKAYFSYMKNSSIIKKNKKFKDIHKSKTVIIIGNGPSLNRINLLALNKYEMFALNDLYLHKDFNNIKIRYYFNMDPREVWFENFKKSVPKETIHSTEFFFPFSQFDRIKKLGSLFTNKNYIISGGQRYNALRKYTDLSLPVLHISNGLQIMLLTAFYMGFTRIYLVGFDYDFLSYKRKFEMPHFHGVDDKRAFVPNENNQNFSVSVSNVGKTLMSLEIISEVLNEGGAKVSILNNKESFLDMFSHTEWPEVYA